MKLLKHLVNRAFSVGEMTTLDVPSEYQKLVALDTTGLTTGDPLYFQYDEVLSNSCITAIETVTSNQLVNYKVNNTFRDVATDALLSEVTFVALDNERKELFRMPMGSMSRTNNGGMPISVNLKTVWANCYVISDPANLGASNCILLRVHYNPY